MSCVLIVDDDEDLRLLLRDLFELTGVDSCVEASSLSDLQAAAQRALACDVAILDINLGAGQPSGLDVYRWLVARNFRGRVAFLTGHAATDPQVREAGRLVDVDVLTKPVDAAILEALTKEPHDVHPI